ncbi:MAG: hypothetical protein CMJ83_12430 [Planctomycetes bacterium]|nr:hypothetical protein [Planctomycetota bacterium]
MRFKLQTDYALRALVYMAAKQGENCTTDEIAGYFQISAAHLGRVIRRLQNHGYVKAIRGRRGGVRLDRDPESVNLGEVVEVLEEGAQPLDPPTGEPGNGVDDALRLKAVLRRAHGLFVNYLNKVTLAELVAEGLPEPQPAQQPSEESAPAEPQPTVAAEPEVASSPEKTPEPVGAPSAAPGYGRPGSPTYGGY